MTLIERLSSKSSIDHETGCWNWTGYIDRRYGYGLFSLRKSPTKLAHRISYAAHRGPIPDGMSVCHRCDNRACINPEHLFLGTQADNNADMMAKGRHVAISGSKHVQAKLSEADVIAIRSSVGVSIRALAAKYGVANSIISMIRTGKRRKSG